LTVLSDSWQIGNCPAIDAGVLSKVLQEPLFPSLKELALVDAYHVSRWKSQELKYLFRRLVRSESDSDLEDSDDDDDNDNDNEEDDS
jgi:hypothetical protein